MIETYFRAERATGLIFAIVGSVALCLAFWSSRQSSFWRGAAWPLAALALIQITVGATVWLRTPGDILRVQQIAAHEPGRIKTEEVPRMEAVMKGFITNRWVGFVLIAIGLTLLAFASREGFFRGIGAGLVMQAGLILLLDLAAQRRGKDYLEWLQNFNA